MLGRIFATSLGGGAVAAFVYSRDRLHAAWTVNYEPVTLWDHNWDQRDPCSCVRPLKTSDPAEQNKFGILLLEF